MHTRTIPTGFLAAIALLTPVLLAGCSEETGQAQAPVQMAVAPAPAPAPSAQPAGAATDPHAGLTLAGARSSAPTSNEGVVVTVEQAGGYTYLQVDRGGAKTWMASASVSVAPGQRVRWGDSAVMRNFTSKALGRTFEEILFVSTVLPADGANPQPASASQSLRATGGGPASGAAGASGRVVAVEQAAGYSYIQVDTNGGTWLAAPMTQVSPGDVVTWQGGSTMRNFESKALGRRFDEIVFVAGVRVGG